MTRVDKNRKTRDIISDEEFFTLLDYSSSHEFYYLALRNSAILCTIRLTGKRREEIAGLKNRDVYITNDKKHLCMNFALLKKHKDKPPEIVKRIPVTDPLVVPIINYMQYIHTRYPNSEEFWFTVRTFFGKAYGVDPDSGISGRQIYNIVRDAGDATEIIVWPHLFRETVGAEEIKNDPTQYGVAKVMQRIDVTERTAWNYMQRYILSIIDRQNSEE